MELHIDYVVHCLGAFFGFKYIAWMGGGKDKGERQINSWTKISSGSFVPVYCAHKDEQGEVQVQSPRAQTELCVLRRGHSTSLINQNSSRVHKQGPNSRKKCLSYNSSKIK